MKRVVVLFVVLVGGLSVGLYFKVRETRAARGQLPGGSGVIEADRVDIAARLASRVTAVPVEEGQRVKAGQVLVELDCREQQALLTAAKARLDMARGQAGAAEAQVDAALRSARAAAHGIQATGAQSQALQATRDATSRQVQRIQKLQGEGGATELDLDRTSTQVKQLGEQIAALKAQADVARNRAAAARATAGAARQQAQAALAAITAAQADVRRAQTLVEECRLRTPISGVVLTRAVEPGEVVLPGSRLLTVVRLEQVETVFYLPNRDLGAAAPGRAVQVVADAFGDRTFPGKILSISAEAEFTPRNVQTREDRDRLVYAVRVSVPNPDRKLRPGMPVEVRIAAARGGAR
jgi:HlyD family secretion protein